MKQHENSLTIRSRQHQADSRNMMLVYVGPETAETAEIQLTKSWKISRYFVQFGLREVAPSTVNLARGRVAAENGGDGRSWGWSKHGGVCLMI